MIHKLYHPTNSGLGLFILRLTLGSIFLIHGIQKLQNMDMVIGFFASLGFSAFLAWLVALIETIGGAMVILGIGARMWASLFSIIMIVAIAVSGGSFKMMELPRVMLGLSFGVGLIGCGSWSMCRMWHKKECSTCQANDNGHCGCTCEMK